MDDAGIIIYLFFYDDSSRIWPAGDTVGTSERDFLTAIVNRFEHHRHLVWVVAEEYQEAFTANRVSRQAAIIRAADNNNHPIAVHKLNGLSFSEFAGDPAIDQFAIQYNQTTPAALHTGVVSAFAQANGRYNLNMSEATQWGQGATARKKAWAVAMGGAYVMGLGVDIASTPVSDLADLGRLRTFMESTQLMGMKPRDDLARADTQYVLADEGSSYILYGTSVTQLGMQSGSAGTFRGSWFDPVTGTTVTQDSLSVSSGSNSWPRPGSIGQEAALYLERTGATSSLPKAPTIVAP
jgi:hypothetical protein